MNTQEYAIKNYLNKHGVYKDNSDMQDIVINSFYAEKGQDNDDYWHDKITFVTTHFGLFAAIRTK